MARGSSRFRVIPFQASSSSSTSDQPPRRAATMVVVMGPEATESDINDVVSLVETAGGDAFVSRGVDRTIVGLVGDVRQFGSLNLRGMRGVRDVIRISVPYKLVSRE